MPIDFADLLGDEDSPIIHPRDIFFTLSRDPAYTFPRDIQTEVLNSWFDERAKEDTIIKLNVGSGKTLVGLLILQSSINEGAGPSLYVAPDKQLAQQVIDEATALGLTVTDNPRDPRYLSGEIICVINIYKLFNGKSVFGVGSSRKKIDIGAVIIDDTHACVTTISNQFRITLKNSEPAYQEIIEILSQDLEAYNRVKYLDLKESDPTVLMEVPFWSWYEHSNEILNVLHAHKTSDSLIYNFPLLSEVLQECRCIIGGQQLEIEPPFPVVDLIKSFVRAKRKIYMTATLSDDSVINTHFSANIKNISKSIVPFSSQSMGERMILIPQELNADITPQEIKGLVLEISKKENVVVIVPSKTAAKEWEDQADQILFKEQIVEGLNRLRNGHVGLTVLINRYDGIDLPHSACRLLLIVDLPEVSSFSEIIDGEVLENSPHELSKQIERIEQGMGRGVRSNDDYCVVLLCGSKLISRIRSPKGKDLLTPATKAQLDLSRKISQRLSSPSVEEIKNVILQCLNRDENWVTVSKRVLIGLPSSDVLRVRTSLIATNEAFNKVRDGQHAKAIEILSKVINETSDKQEQAWLLAKKASMQHPIDAAEAQKALIKAHSLERSVLKPLVGITYRKLESCIEDQANRLINHHDTIFLTPIDMILHSQHLCDDLQFKEGTSNKFEGALNDFARFIGIQGHRPEKEYGAGPDNMWLFPNNTFLVIECKNEVLATNNIAKKDAGQLGQSMRWFEAKYNNVNSTPVMVHPSQILKSDASLVSGMRIINEKKLNNLRISLKKFSKELENPAVNRNVIEITKRLNQYGLTANEFINRYTVEAKSGK